MERRSPVMEVKAPTLVQQPVPRLLEGGQTTKHDSTHNLQFKSTLGHWSGFESEVRQAFVSTRWTDEVLAFQQQQYTRNHINNEQLFCGDEHSVVARFGQNVGHTMTSVYQSIGVNSRFADYKVCSDGTLGGDVPDIAILSNHSRVQVLGEAKTPWMHDIRQKLNEDMPGFRRYLGQIAKYMYMGKVKYGFLTTYDQTVFLKQEPSRQRPGRWVLWYTNVIFHNAPSTFLGRDDFRFKNRHLYGGKVSLRECFLFLAHKIRSGDYKVENTMNDKHWIGAAIGASVGSRKPKSPLDSDHISDSDESSGSESTSGSPTGAPTASKAREATMDSRKDSRSSRSAAIGPTTRSRATGPDDLSSRTAHLSLADTSAHDTERRTPGPITVYADSAQYYYLDNHKRAVAVTLFRDKGTGQYYFTMNGHNYEANLVQARHDVPEPKHEKRRK